MFVVSGLRYAFMQTDFATRVSARRFFVEVLMSIRSAYDGSRVAVVIRSGPGRTKQAFREECNINTIMAKYQRTGLIEAVNKIQPQYADVAGVDFHFCMDQLVKAQEMFLELPSSVRKRFHNDPGEFLSFVGDPANRDEAVKLGLIVEPPEAPEAPVQVPVPPAAPAGSAPG